MKITSVIWFLGRSYNENINDLSGSSTLKPLRDFVIVFQRKILFIWFVNTFCSKRKGDKSVYFELFTSFSSHLYHNWTRNFVSNFFSNKNFWTIIVFYIHVHFILYSYSLESSWWILRNKTKLRFFPTSVWGFTSVYSLKSSCIPGWWSELYNKSAQK